MLIKQKNVFLLVYNVYNKERLMMDADYIQNKEMFIRKNIFACLFSVHNTISLASHEQVCLMFNVFKPH